MTDTIMGRKPRGPNPIYRLPETKKVVVPTADEKPEPKEVDLTPAELTEIELGLDEVDRKLQEDLGANYFAPGKSSASG